MPEEETDEGIAVVGPIPVNKGGPFINKEKKLAGFMQKLFLRKKLDSQIFFRVE